ncbi:MAG: type II toxin-antitoxin system RelE/ParE family toxin [Thermoanaerobaculia bacterium]
MIRTFGDSDTELLFNRGRPRRIPSEVQRAALRKLVLLDASDALQDLRVPPGNRLEALKGKRSGQYSIRVNDQWRVCFVWRGTDAFDVQIVDYH